MSKIYAGIGARDTPNGVLFFMADCGHHYAEEGYTLRSGGAKGADKAFEGGASYSSSGLVDIYRPEDATEDAIAIASLYHPNWGACSEYARKLHGRNSMIMLGQELDKPVDFVVCWTLHGAVAGGTGQALRMAKALGIPVYNLSNDNIVLP